MNVDSDPKTNAIRTIHRPVCVVCGASRGKLRYEGLRDRLFQTPGTWNLVECSNKDCGTLWLDPAPLPADIPQLYRSYYTHQVEGASQNTGRGGWLARGYRKVVAAYLHKKYRYGQKPEGSFSSWLPFLLHLLPGRSELIDYNVAYQPAMVGGRLFEIGCGSGESLRYLERLGWEVEGADFDPQAVSAARRSGLNVLCGDPRDLSIVGAAYDVVIMGHVIEHVLEPRKLFAECARLLKPGGLLVVSTPNVHGLGHRLMGRHWLHLDPPRHLQMYSPQGLARICKDAGFRILVSRSTTRDASGVFSAWMNLRFRGHHGMTQRPSLIKKVISYFWQILAMGAVAIFPSVGDELVCILKKPLDKSS